MLGFPADRHWRQALWLILLTALGLRIAAAIGLQHLLDHVWHRTFLIPGDAEGYWELARRMAAGEDYAIYQPPRQVLRMPGFPALLALSIRLFGESLFAARLLLAVVGTVGCWLVYLLGRQMQGERVGVLAAALAAVSPTFIVFSVTMLSETCFALALVANLMCGDRLYREIEQGGPWQRRLAWSIATGLGVALGTYFRPSWLAAGPLFSALLLLFCRSKWKGLWSGGMVLMVLFLSLLPWGLRNQRVTGHFKLTTLWMGPSLYDGWNSQATGDSDMRFFDEEQVPLQMSEFEVDRHYRQRAIEFAKNNPWRVLELAAIKLWRYFKPWPNAAEFGNVWISTIVGAYFLTVAALAAYGVGSGRATIWSVVILVGPIVYFAVLHMVFVSSLRYRLPAEYPLLVLSGLGWIQLREPGGVRAGDQAGRAAPP